jgi:hypothetical protein
MARNLTPESNGQPEALTEAEFIKVMRTGEDIHCEKNQPTRFARSVPLLMSFR